MDWVVDFTNMTSGLLERPLKFKYRMVCVQQLNETANKLPRAKSEPLLRHIKYGIKGVKMEEDSTNNPISKDNVQRLCEKEIEAILFPAGADSKLQGRSNSVTQAKREKKYKFEVLKDSKSKLLSRRDKKSESDAKEEPTRLKRLALVGKENVSPNIAGPSSAFVKTQQNPTTSQDVLHPEIKHVSRRACQSILVVPREQTISMKSSNSQKYENISPILPNPATANNNIINGRPARPKVQRRSALKDLKTITGPIYRHEEYLDNILKNSKELELKLVLPANFLRKYNPDTDHRFVIVNWILIVQNIFKLSNGEIYLAVNLLDQVLARIKTPLNMYQLVALTSIWIGNKILGVKPIPLRLLVHICSKVYDGQQVLKMEQRILRLLNFSIHCIEPTLFVDAYLTILNIDFCSRQYFTVYFVLDCAIHLNEYSTVPTSIVGAAAMMVAFKTFHREMYDGIKTFLCERLSSEELKACRIMQVAMTCQIGQIKNDNGSRVILNKYKDHPWF